MINDKQQINEIKQDFKMHKEKHKQIKEMIYDILIAVENERIKEARKETAREILEIIKREYDYIGDLERIIAKQYGVEIKE